MPSMQYAMMREAARAIVLMMQRRLRYSVSAAWESK